MFPNSNFNSFARPKVMHTISKLITIFVGRMNMFVLGLVVRLMFFYFPIVFAATLAGCRFDCCFISGEPIFLFEKKKTKQNCKVFG